MTSSLEQQTEFDGVYVQHWEVARFAVVTGRRFFGLFPRVVLLSPDFPDGLLEAHGIQPLTERVQGGTFRMRVRGRLGPFGHYGHRGICSHELRVDQILACEKTDDPGPTW